MKPHTARLFRLFVLRWHRRIGLVLCVAILWICTTGILLNHMHDWKLAERLSTNAWLAQQYAVTTPRYFAVGDGNDSNNGTVVVQSAMGELIVNQRAVGQCNTPLQGVARTTHTLALACTDKLFILTPAGDVLDIVSGSDGLPAPVIGLAVADNHLLVQAQRWHRLDTNSLRFSAYTGGIPSARGAQLAAVPDAITSQLGDRLKPQPVSWERLLIDLHTGAFWGGGKQVISDVVAILLMLIAIGGVWVWFTKPGRFSR